MSTLPRLERQGKVVRYEPDLSEAEQPFRALWLTKRCAVWIERVAPNIRDRGPLFPDEQVKILFDAYCGGRPLHDGGDVKRLERLDEGIYELKTTDVRIFGGFVSKGAFLAAVPTAKKTVSRTSYRTFVKEARKAIDALGVDVSFGETARSLNDVL